MYKCKLPSNCFLSHTLIGRKKVSNLTQAEMKLLHDKGSAYIEFQEPKKEPEKQETEEEPKKSKSTIKK
jgi:hypothetical protein